MTTRDTAHKDAVQTLVDDAMRWRKLIRLVGIPSNGSHSKISLYWDDATHTRWISTDQRPYYIEHGTFADILDSIQDDDSEELGLR